MDGAGAGGAARERRKQLTAAEAVNHKRQLAQMVERELALTGADSVTDFDDALQMVLVETAFGRYPKHLLDVYTGKVVGRQERGDVVKSWQHVEKMSAPGGATGDEGNDGFGDDDEILLCRILKYLEATVDRGIMYTEQRGGSTVMQMEGAPSAEKRVGRKRSGVCGRRLKETDRARCPLASRRARVETDDIQERFGERKDP